MAWSTPRTWTALETATAAMMNTIRDNLLETAPAKAAASGDIFYATGANAIAKLAKGTNGHVLTLASGLPSWAAASASFIQSLQVVSGTCSGSTTGSITISSVTTTRAALVTLGRNGSHGYADRSLCYGLITAATTISLTKQTAASDAYISFAVIEYKSGILTSLQSGTLALGTGTTADQTISAVTIANSYPSELGCKHTAANELVSGWPSSLAQPSLTSTTNLRFTRAAANVDSAMVGWQVVEFASADF